MNIQRLSRIVWRDAVFIGGEAMRKNQRTTQVCGRIFIVAGLLVLLSRILPAGFWWIMLGVTLISVGMYMKHWC